jgi:hypothetical protein
MAFECPILDFTWPANADLTTKQYKWVKLNSSGKIVPCDTAGELALGVLQNTPRINEGASVRVAGISKVVLEVNDSLNPMDTVGTSENGNATKVNLNVTGADLGDVVNGQIVDYAAVAGSNPAGALGSVLIRPMGRVTG